LTKESEITSDKDIMLDNGERTLSNWQPTNNLLSPTFTGGAAAGRQVLLDLHKCSTQHLDDIAWARATLTEAARRAHATIIDVMFHKFSPHGISGVVVIAESHLALHTWPEKGYAAIDIFTCGPTLALRKAVDYLVDVFQSSNPQLSEVLRGGSELESVALGDPTPLHVPHSAEEHGAKSKRKIKTNRPVDAEQWYEDRGSWGEIHRYRVRKTLLRSRTQFQEVAIIDTEKFGKMLVLDGDTQSAQCDEYIYHEALVHPALTLHPNPRRVLVIGGGEGATIREVLRHPMVERVTMIDIDGELVEQCKLLLPEWHQGAFVDPRVDLRYEDGFAYVTTSADSFDIIIIDIGDQNEHSPAMPLYSEHFYRVLKTRLTANGILVVQASELTVTAYEHHAGVRSKLMHLFEQVQSYACFVPSFWCEWGFVLATNAYNPMRQRPEMIDAVLNERGLSDQLRYYDGLTQQRLTALPKDLRLWLDSPPA
jgi:spermidine synthase